MQHFGNFVFGAVQKCVYLDARVYLVDLVKSFPTSIYYLVVFTSTLVFRMYL